MSGSPPRNSSECSKTNNTCYITSSTSQVQNCSKNVTPNVSTANGNVPPCTYCNTAAQRERDSSTYSSQGTAGGVRSASCQQKSQTCVERDLENESKNKGPCGQPTSKCACQPQPDKKAKSQCRIQEETNTFSCSAQPERKAKSQCEMKKGIERCSCQKQPEQKAKSQCKVQEQTDRSSCSIQLEKKPKSTCRIKIDTATPPPCPYIQPERKSEFQYERKDDSPSEIKEETEKCPCLKKTSCPSVRKPCEKPSRSPCVAINSVTSTEIPERQTRSPCQTKEKSDPCPFAANNSPCALRETSENQTKSPCMRPEKKDTGSQNNLNPCSCKAPPVNRCSTCGGERNSTCGGERNSTFGGERNSTCGGERNSQANEISNYQSQRTIPCGDQENQDPLRNVSSLPRATQTDPIPGCPIENIDSMKDSSAQQNGDACSCPKCQKQNEPEQNSNPCNTKQENNFNRVSQRLSNVSQSACPQTQQSNIQPCQPSPCPVKEDPCPQEEPKCPRKDKGCPTKICGQCNKEQNESSEVDFTEKDSTEIDSGMQKNKMYEFDPDNRKVYITGCPCCKVGETKRGSLAADNQSDTNCNKRPTRTVSNGCSADAEWDCSKFVDKKDEKCGYRGSVSEEEKRASLKEKRASLGGDNKEKRSSLEEKRASQAEDNEEKISSTEENMEDETDENKEN